MTNDQLWQATLGELELLISKANFTTWLSGTFIASYESGRVVIGVPNAFTKAWLEKKYHSAIFQSLKSSTKDGVREILYEVHSQRKGPPERVAGPALDDDAPSVSPEFERSGLNPRYTFEKFVVGGGSELAHAACLAVADRPGKAYNPLFLYGGVGLGKTHLMQAVGGRVLVAHPRKRVLYVTCERFTNDFIASIQQGKADAFKKQYRSVDILLVDDIQFLAGKEQTQEEFFHTFNALHQANKQIVLTSDRPPKSLPSLEHRLISRFEWGMVADIAQPDLETRLAILRAKCQEKNISISQEILNYIAANVHSNVRELEGALNRILAYSQLQSVAPTLDEAKSLLSSVTSSPARSGITTQQLIQTVASFFDISIEDLAGASRKKELVVPRQITMYLMREELKNSYPNIGQELGGRDHTTAMHACAKISIAVEHDQKIRQDIALIRQRLYIT